MDRQRRAPVRLPARVFWDYENVPIPRGSDVNVVMRGLHSTLRDELGLEVDGVKVYSRARDQPHREALQDLGCECVDPTKAKKRPEVVDMRICADLAAFALCRVKDTRRSAVVVISNDQDFSYILSVVRNHGLDVFVIAGTAVAKRLVSIATKTMTWASMIAGALDESSSGSDSSDASDASDASDGESDDDDDESDSSGSDRGSRADDEKQADELSAAWRGLSLGGGRGSPCASDTTLPDMISRDLQTNAVYLLRIVDDMCAATGAAHVLMSQVGLRFHTNHSRDSWDRKRRKTHFKRAINYTLATKGYLEQVGRPPGHRVGLTDAGRALLELHP